MEWIRVDLEERHEGWAWVITSEYNTSLINYLRRVKRNHQGWDHSRGVWIVPANEEIAIKLVERFNAIFTLDALQRIPHLFPEKFSVTIKDQIKKFIPEILNDEVKIEGLNHPLYPFQAKGIILMTLLHGRVLLADEMGLGKTVQSLGFIAYNRLGKTLIVCTKSTKRNWQKELCNWIEDAVPSEIEIVNGTKPHPLNRDKRFYIINYNILKHWEQELANLNFEILILDECHYIKNSKTQWTKTVINIAEKISYVLALTVTPILNRTVEIWNILKLLRPDIFVRKADFLRMFTYDSTGELSKLTKEQAEKFVVK